MRCFTALVGLTGLLFWGGAGAAASAHPGAHVGVKISIDDDRVLLSILLSNDYSRQLVADQSAPPIYSESKGGYTFSDPQQGERIRAAFDDFFSEANWVLINNQEATPKIQRFDYVHPIGPARAFSVNAEAPDLEIDLAYACPDRPKQVSIAWELFPEDPALAAVGRTTVTAVLAELDAYSQRQIVVFSMDEPEVIWHASATPVIQRVQPVVAKVTPKQIAIPIVSAAATGAWLISLIVVWLSRSASKLRRPVLYLTILPLAAAWFCRGLAVAQVTAPWSEKVEPPTELEAVEIFSELHANIYKAFDFKTESDIYDVLAQSVSGDLLEQVYNEVYQGLIMRDQGGAIARVYSVDVKNAEMLSAGRVETGEIAFKLRCLWQVYGVVSHWGHFHSRTNEYRADYTVAQLGENWKITGAEVLEQRRLDDEDEVDDES